MEIQMRIRKFPMLARLALLLGLVSVLADPAVARPPFRNEQRAQAQPQQAQPPAAQPAPAQPAPAQPAQPSAQPPVPAPAAPAAQPAPAPAAPAPLKKKPAAADVQILLDRSGFSPGVIDGMGGSNTRKALAAFQAARGLPGAGEVDATTWQALTADGPTTLAAYRITAEDVDGPFVRNIPEDMMEKSKLPALGYTSALEMLGERFHASPDFLRKLNRGARFAAGETIRVPAVRRVSTEPVKAPEGLQVVVSKGTSTLTVQQGDRVLFFAPVSAGSEHDPLPIGDWTVKGVSRDPSFNYNPDLFWDGDPEHSKAKIPPGPNNPVGLVWIDLSKEHYGIHGTPEPRMIGRSLSHGCVRLTNWDALTLAALVEPGTPVLFRE
jgi:lipoprotein-anchoring transpeptidase ErfK/SrfK